ncbi:MAG: aminobutyraldehyde dehydrogenase [Actinobacteria bacterium]|nr:aminobutyraldehyde dehydrogenase [Actinomycetota bacterium]
MNRAIINPATGQVIREIADSTTRQVDEAISRALTAFTPWSESTPGERSKKILDYADLLEKHADEICELEVSETGKPWSTMREGEFPFGLDNLRFFAGAARSLDGTGAGSFNHGYTSLLVRKPVGVIGSISPWNFPFIMAIWKIGPALAAGNTVVIKPAPQTPSSTIKLIELAKQIFAPGTIEVILGDAEVAQQLVKDPRISMVSITGSSDSGRKVMQAASETTKRVHLELGGKAPVIVREDADLTQVAQAISLACTYNSGQDCTAATRIYAHHSVVKDLEKLMKQKMESIKVGDPKDKSSDIGPLISEKHRYLVHQKVQKAINDGATLITGGKVIDGIGFYYTPTLLSNVKQDNSIIQTEVFGPVITITSVKDDEEAIKLANDSEYGLASSIWTKDVGKALEISKKIQAGVTWINDHLPIISEGPHGGVKGSGFGKDMSQESVLEYTTTHHIMIKHGQHEVKEGFRPV